MHMAIADITALQQVPQLVLGNRFAAGGKRRGRKGREEKEKEMIGEGKENEGRKGKGKGRRP